VPGMRATPKQIAQVIALREAGYGYASICQKTGLSPATVTRVNSRHSVKKGAIRSKLIEAARLEIVEELSCDSAIRNQIKKLLLDNIGHSELCRNKMLEALGHLHPSSTESAAVVIRACTSYATAIKASSDAVRPLLKDLEEDDRNEALPELIIRRMTDGDVAVMRAEQVRESDLMGLYEKDDEAYLEGEGVSFE